MPVPPGAGGFKRMGREVIAQARSLEQGAFWSRHGHSLRSSSECRRGQPMAAPGFGWGHASLPKCWRKAVASGTARF